ncbi:hypothetical protein [Nocardia rhamnosiphila]
MELGKELAARITAEPDSDDPLAHDSSTNALITRYRQERRRAGHGSTGQ